MIEDFSISPLATELQAKLQHKIDSKTKPVGALGRLEDLALQVGLIQQRLSPDLTNPVLALFAGDHGIAKEEPVSSYPQEVTRQMVQNYLQGGAAVNVFCRMHNISPKIIDAGIASDVASHSDLIDRKIAKGTRNYTAEPAMSRAQCVQAMEAGAALADDWQAEGTNVIAFGEMGIGNTSSASLITSLITGTPIRKCTGKGTGLQAEAIRQKVDILQSALKKHSIEAEPMTILSTFGGFEIVMMVGAMLKAAEHRMVLIVDGFISTAAFLVAHQMYPQILGYAVFAHKSGERGHKLQLDFLNVKPLLQLDMRLGEGTGAVLSYPILQAAVAFLNEMASFDDAGVSKKEDR